MSRNPPETGTNELLIVLLCSLVPPPHRFLVISNDLEKKAGGNEAKRDEVPASKAWMTICRNTINLLTEQFITEVPSFVHHKVHTMYIGSPTRKTQAPEIVCQRYKRDLPRPKPYRKYLAQPNKT